jgi:hypothetical protein
LVDLNIIALITATTITSAAIIKWGIKIFNKKLVNIGMIKVKYNVSGIGKSAITTQLANVKLLNAALRKRLGSLRINQRQTIYVLHTELVVARKLNSINLAL